MRGTRSARPISTRHRHSAGRSRSAGVLGALSVVVMAAALGTLVLEGGDPAAASPTEVAAVADGATGRDVLVGTDRSSRPQRSTAAPSTTAPTTTPEVAVAPTTTVDPTTQAPVTTRSTPAAKPSPKPAPAPQPAAPAPEPAPAPAPAAPLAAGSGQTIQAYITGYTWHDNTPAGSPQISHPQMHRTAGGSGTFEDPITLAVGHDKSSGRSVLDWPAGTRFYVPAFSRYLIVEDTCGDGGSPENGACHTGYPSSASTWLDIWVDGRDAGESESSRCAGAVTGVTQVIVNPTPGLPVQVGPLSSGGRCAV